MGSADEIVASSDAEFVPIAHEKIDVVTESQGDDFGKPELHIDDEAGALAVQALASGPAEAAISKKVLKKIDLYILPFLCITYGRYPLINILKCADISRSPIPG
ncbi:unnamed protein product [Sphagnum balticum]